MIIWGVYLDKVKENRWIITPLIGAAIAAPGNNIVATVLTAFAIDSSPEFAPDIGLYLNLVRQIFGFLGPFYFHDMFHKLKFARSAGLMCGLVLVFGVGAMTLVHVINLCRAKRVNLEDLVVIT